GNAKEILNDAELRFGIDLPDEMAVSGMDAMKHALGAIGIDTVVIHDGATPGTIVVTVVILVFHRVVEGPQRLAGLTLHAGEDGPITVAIELVKPPSTNRGHSVTGADLFVPDHARSAARPGRDKPLFRGDAGSERPQEGRPVGASFSGPEVRNLREVPPRGG